jgi:uncharacterized protein YukJ
MPIRNYGVWKARPVSYRVDGPDDRSPHINLVFADNHRSNLKAAINVKSRSNPSELVYWVDHHFTAGITQALDRLEYGFHSVDINDPETGRLALDYYRSHDLLVLKRGRLLPYLEDGPDDDILDQLKPILNQAIRGRADIYLFGSQFDRGDGIRKSLEPCATSTS